MRTAKPHPFVLVGESRTARLLWGEVSRPQAYTLATFGVGFVVAVSYVLHGYLPYSDLSLLFMAAVFLTATKTGLGPAIYSAVLCFLAYNFFFTSPYYTFAVDSESDVTTLGFFLVMAMLSGSLGSRLRIYVEETRSAMERMSDVAAFSRRMGGAVDAQDVIKDLVDYLNLRLGLAAVAVTTGSEARSGTSEVTAASAEGLVSDLAAGTSLPPGWDRFELATATAVVGKAAVAGQSNRRDQRDLVGALCNQAAVALERTRLVSDLEREKVRSETEQLRAALLSSVSHDLRTPLASVIGSVSTLIELGDNLPAKDKLDLLATVQSEAERLDRYIQNLLDMTRLGQGTLALHRDWCDLNDIVASARRRLGACGNEVSLTVHVERDLPLLYVHAALIEQAVVNLLDNAFHHGDASSEVQIRGYRKGDVAQVDVIGRGPGIPEPERQKVFDMFYSVRHGDSKGHGTGLGLAIAQGMVGAHGGSIEALEGPGGVGTCMRIRLPIEPSPERSK